MLRMPNINELNFQCTNDIVAFYVYKFGNGRIARSKSALAEALGIAAGSFQMRVLNFKAIDGSGGLGHYARQSLEVYKQYQSAAESELRAIVLSAIRL